MMTDALLTYALLLGMIVSLFGAAYLIVALVERAGQREQARAWRERQHYSSTRARYTGTSAGTTRR